MNNLKQKIKNIRIPFNQSTMAFVFSIFAVAFAVGSFDSPCLSAQGTCAIGSDNEFSGNISLKGGTANKGTFDVSGMTADRTWTLPDASGTLAVAGATLPASKVMATDLSGNESTTNVYPLSLTSNSPLKTDGTGNLTASDLDPETDLTIGTGLANQILGVNSGATALTFTSITGVPTLTASKSVSTTAGGDLETNDVYPLSLTASTPLKTNATGEVTASDLDITTDITAGTSLQQIRTNAGGTALEFFTPSGGGDYTKVASGNMVVSTADSQMVIACWYGQHTLDPTKEYTLHIDSGTVEDALSSGYNKFRAQKNDCTSGGGLEFDSVMASMWSVGGRMGNVTSNIVSASYCYGVGGGTSNSIYARASNIAGRFNFRPYKDDDGLNLDWTLTGVNYNNSNVPYGIQAGTGGCIVHYSNDPLNFNTITGMHMFLEGNGDTTRTWALYETDI